MLAPKDVSGLTTAGHWRYLAPVLDCTNRHKVWHNSKKKNIKKNTHTRLIQICNYRSKLTETRYFFSVSTGGTGGPTVPPAPPTGPPVPPPAAPGPATATPVEGGGRGLLPLDVFGAVTIPLKWNPLERERKKQGVNNFNLNKIGHGHYRVYKKKRIISHKRSKGGKER